MSDLLSIPEAADELSLHPSRVRALAADGALPAIKIGRHWAIDRAAVARRLRGKHGAGRPFEPHNAWALLLLASGDKPDWLSAKEHWRFRQLLRVDGLSGLASRLERRGRRRELDAHPGELSHVLADRHLIRSGVSAAGSYELDLVSGAEADGYLAASRLNEFEHAHALEPASLGAGNVLVRVVPDSAWHFSPGQNAAPQAAVALDLVDDVDPRSQRAGRELLKRIDGT